MAVWEKGTGWIWPVGWAVPAPALSHRVEFLPLNSFRTGSWLQIEKVKVRNHKNNAYFNKLLKITIDPFICTYCDFFYMGPRLSILAEVCQLDFRRPPLVFSLTFLIHFSVKWNLKLFTNSFQVQNTSNFHGPPQPLIVVPATLFEKLAFASTFPKHPTQFLRTAIFFLIQWHHCRDKEKWHKEV